MSLHQFAPADDVLPMGAWGTGIFQDDFAADLRNFYMELAALQFTDEAILAELQRQFGRSEGLEETTFWIALALVQHKLGRLDDTVKGRALEFIDSGRALQAWAALTEEGAPSIPSRHKQLLKARATLESPLPKRKTLRPTQELCERIDRTYSAFPWQEGGLYAYQSPDETYAVVAAVRVLSLTLGRHYARQRGGFVPVSLPPLPQPALLLLDYRRPHLPTPQDIAALQPLVRPITPADRKAWLEVIAETHAMHQANAAQSFADFHRENRANHARKTDEEFRQHYEWWVAWSGQQRRRYADRTAALRRYFYVLLLIDARLPIPVERLVDLKTTRHFDCETSCLRATWDTLDHHLLTGQPLDTRHTVELWPAA